MRRGRRREVKWVARLRSRGARETREANRTFRLDRKTKERERVDLSMRRQLKHEREARKKTGRRGQESEP
jgi:hypothetical protein